MEFIIIKLTPIHQSKIINLIGKLNHSNLKDIKYSLYPSMIGINYKLSIKKNHTSYTILKNNSSYLDLFKHYINQQLSEIIQNKQSKI